MGLPLMRHTCFGYISINCLRPSTETGGGVPRPWTGCLPDARPCRGGCSQLLRESYQHRISWKERALIWSLIWCFPVCAPWISRFCSTWEFTITEAPRSPQAHRFRISKAGVQQSVLFHILWDTFKYENHGPKAARPPVQDCLGLIKEAVKNPCIQMPSWILEDGPGEATGLTVIPALFKMLKQPI